MHIIFYNFIQRSIFCLLCFVLSSCATHRLDQVPYSKQSILNTLSHDDMMLTHKDIKSSSLEKIKIFKQALINCLESKSTCHLHFYIISKKCPCSNSHMNHLKSLALKSQTLGNFNVFIEVSDDLSPEEFHKEYQNTKTWVLYDPKKQLAHKVGAIRTPQVFILNESHIIYKGAPSNTQHFGRKSKSHILPILMDQKNNGLKKHYDGHEALGCYIQYPLLKE